MGAAHAVRVARCSGVAHARRRGGRGRLEQKRVRNQIDGRDDEGARRRHAGAKQGHHVLLAPDIAENGAVVPIGIASAIPKTESIAILVEKNPNMLAAVFDIPAGTEPKLTTRIKMGQTSNVYALVKADGKYYVARRKSRSPSADAAADATRAKEHHGRSDENPRERVGDSTEVKVLMSHEMETGQRKDAQGKTIPAWFIQNVKATHNGKMVLAAQWGPRSRRTRSCRSSSRAAQGRQGADHLGRQPRRQAHRRSGHRLIDVRAGRRATSAATTVARTAGREAPARQATAIDEEIDAHRIVRGRRRGRARAWRSPRRRVRADIAVDEIAKYRAALQDGNPAELWEARGEELWKKNRGPRKVVARAVRSRPRARRRQGRVRATAALLRRRQARDGPRDAARLVHGEPAGISEADATKNPFGGGSEPSPTWRRSSRTSRPSRAASR